MKQVMKGTLRLLGSLACFVFLLAQLHASAEQPNIVVILVDDAGFMDFGGFGGEARTPNIDQLADAGVRFSNYHTSPLCATSRAMLLTGLDSHRTGVGTIPEILRKEQRESPAYSLHLLPGVETVADQFRGAGYETFMTGKWHLGRGPGDLPDSHGFDRSFALDASGADNWEQKPFIPFYSEAPWFEDGKPAKLPDDFYSSRFLVDHMIDYLSQRDPDHPFFAYVAFQAIHIPIQAPREFTDHYKGVYSDGWEATLRRRFERAKALGLIPPDAAPPAMHPSLRKWDSLTPKEQAYFERRMMVNAGMLEAMDYHVGRLIEYLKSSGDFDNTIFVVTSDNGPEFGDPTTDPVFRIWMATHGYNDHLETMGEKGSMAAIGPEWASAAATPGRLFKMYASEGGTRVPLIISGPGIAPQRFNSALSFVTDIAPTLTELAELEEADVDGRSLAPALMNRSNEIHGDHEPIALEVGGNSAVFKGGYKLTRNTLPHGDAEWHLHDLAIDPGETRDLSGENTALKEELLADYAQYAKKMGVIALPADFDVQEQISINARRMMLKRARPLLFAAGLILFAIIVLLVRWLRRRKIN